VKASALQSILVPHISRWYLSITTICAQGNALRAQPLYRRRADDTRSGDAFNRVRRAMGASVAMFSARPEQREVLARMVPDTHEKLLVFVATESARPQFSFAVCFRLNQREGPLLS
jgi:hypothetical protein